jgi:hypothetical protein
MTAVNDVLRAIREVVVMNERIVALSKQVDEVQAREAELRERVIRLEVFIDIVRPVITRRTLAPPK